MLRSVRVAALILLLALATSLRPALRAARGELAEVCARKESAWRAPAPSSRSILSGTTVHSAQADGTAQDVLEVHMDGAGAAFVMNGDALARLHYGPFGRVLSSSPAAIASMAHSGRLPTPRAG